MKTPAILSKLDVTLAFTVNPFVVTLNGSSVFNPLPRNTMPGRAEGAGGKATSTCVADTAAALVSEPAGDVGDVLPPLPRTDAMTSPPATRSRASAATKGQALE